MATRPSSSGGGSRYPVHSPMQKGSRKVRIVEEDAMEVDKEERQVAVKLVGEVVRVSGTGVSKVNHYKAFEVNGIRVKLEDPALITPGEGEDIGKLNVAIIKDITQDPKTRKVTAKVQWLYRPKEAKKEGGGSWDKDGSRLLFYSFQYDSVPAEYVIHPCIVHFIPWYKRLPDYRKHPGFVVKSFYDINKKKLVKLTDVIDGDDRHDEIYLLLNKTMEHLGDLPDSHEEEISLFYKEKVDATKNLLRKKKEISRMKDIPENEGPSEYHTILLSFHALTRQEPRNKRLEKLLQSLEQACMEGENQLIWPGSAVSAATALEKACKDRYQDFSKYNQKLRSLEYNLKKNIVLARRLLKEELGPSKILNMSSTELKEGLTAEELARNQPEEPQSIQMTDACCRRCGERRVGLASRVKAGHKDLYELECHACGKSWYVSSNDFSMMTVRQSPPWRQTTPSTTAKHQRPEKEDGRRRP